MFNRKHKPYEPPMICPACGANEFSVVCLLYSGYYSEGKPKLEQDGYRCSCQRCGAVYSVGPEGTYLHHPQSLPWTPTPKAIDDLMPAALRQDNQRATKPPPRPPNATNDPLPMRFPKASR